MSDHRGTYYMSTAAANGVILKRDATIERLTKELAEEKEASGLLGDEIENLRHDLERQSKLSETTDKTEECPQCDGSGLRVGCLGSGE